LDRSLIIDAKGEDIEIALLENKKLVEFNRESDASQFKVGDLYLARVRKLVKGLNAAFVDVGYERDAFLHYTDLSPYIRSILKFTQHTLSGKQSTHLLDDFKFEKRTSKKGKVTQVLNQNQPILVQVEKEPISSKGPRLSCELTLAGRFLVLYPFNEMIGVSKQIKKRKERKRLKNLIKSIKPDNFGVIVRTAATGKKVAELDRDLNNLLDRWEFCFREMKAAGHKDLGKVETPKKVLGEVGRAKKLLRDLLNQSFNHIIVNDDALDQEVKEYIGKIAPKQEKIVQLYKGQKPVFDKFNVTNQIKASFGKFVNLPKGAYLVVERTEAFHVIDVNSGNRVDHKNSIEKNAKSINKSAAEEIARQLRLRDMGGMILIDFIDMKNPKYKRAVFDKMKDEMRRDRTRHTILPLSKLNIMQIARQRVRPAVRIDTSEECPTCLGTGKVQPPILMVDQLEEALAGLCEQDETPFTIRIRLHPFLAAYIDRGVVPLKWKWAARFKKRLKLLADEDCHMTDFEFYDNEGHQLDLPEPAS
jgi:ribonuclease G